ncbi:MAG: NUDIX domain-containing protein [Thermodesulfobacteriota bacterium]|jgi:8-oxo-dGTP pyrophosphatase MutT (NUDIX family)
MNLIKTLGLPVIQSAGGLVYNNDYHILLIFKKGKWDLPKGGLSAKESSHIKTAVREVNEETGIDKDKLEVKGKIVSTWHSTRNKKGQVLKKTHWYLMHYNGKDADVIPQLAEGIIECRWVHLSDLDSYRPLILTRIQYVIDFWLENLAYDTNI